MSGAVPANNITGASTGTGLGLLQAILTVYKPEHFGLSGEVPMLRLEDSGSNQNDVYMQFIKNDYDLGFGQDTGADEHHYRWNMGITGDRDAADGDKFMITSGSAVLGVGNPVLSTQIFTITGQKNDGDNSLGRVGINNASPDYPLEVDGYNASNISIFAERDIAAYSDVRTKTDILTISGSLDIIGNIRGVTYKNKVSGSAIGSRMMGVIAQELEPYLPEIVSTDNKGFKSVKYGNLTALLIQAVKEQQEQIEELKQEIKEIKDAVSS